VISLRKVRLLLFNTIFGEVTSGMDVVNKINAVETDKADKPKETQKIMKVYVKP